MKNALEEHREHQHMEGFAPQFACAKHVQSMCKACDAMCKTVQKQYDNVKTVCYGKTVHELYVFSMCSICNSNFHQYGPCTTEMGTSPIARAVKPVAPVEPVQKLQGKVYVRSVR
jgi:hypothetical protein